MKNIFSLLFISASLVSFSQNLNNETIQQQAIQVNVSNNDNVIGNFTNVQSNPFRGNTFNNSNVQVQQFNPRGNRGGRVSRSANLNVNNFQNNIEVNAPSINLELQNKQNEEEVQIQISDPNINLNLNVNLPKLSLVKEKEAPKRLDDYRIKTSGSSSSGTSSKHTTKKKKSFTKAVTKPIKCWWNKKFRNTIKFQFSCDCFKF